ncbi:MAG: TRAP transporter substrate-binding protein [Treponema sp.]|nr:TRAP transporter substrate-binding protein [Treponema sp.]
MKKSILAAAIPLILFSSCKKEDPKKVDDAPITLLMAEVNPEDSICGKMDFAFKQKVEELSNGKIHIDLKCAGILGDESQVMKIFMSENPTIQLVRISASLAKYGGKKSRLLSIPFTFSNAEHFWKFASSDIADEILNEPYELNLGMRGLFYGEEGFRHFFSTEKIASIEDMKGRKTRVSGQVLTDLAKSLKATPVEVPFTDLYSSLQTGKTEVAEQPISNYLTNSFHKVAPYIILDGHMLGAVQVLISSKAWDSLSENQQRILVAAGKYASDYCRKIAAESEEDIKKQLMAEGATITSVNDITPWQEACKAMIADSSKDYPELYKKILDLAK